MNQSAPLLTSSDTILWLKVVLTAGLLAASYLRRSKAQPSGAGPKAYSLGAKALVAVAVLFSFGAFHSFGAPRSGAFVHYGDMFHYYLGSKYFDEVGYYELYNAVIAADAEQDNELAAQPFYTNLSSYRNASRETALARAEAVRSLFSKARWDAFKHDLAFFKSTRPPSSPSLVFLLMDHGYNASPVSTVVLGTLTNLVPVTQLPLLASLDVLFTAAMIALVFRTFGFEVGGLFGTYFFVNILNDHAYISGGLLRYDWLFCIVVAVCMLEKRRHAAAAFFLTVAAMLKVFPVVLLCGAGLSTLRRAKAARVLDRAAVRFTLAAGATGLALFLISAMHFGSVLQPWQEFSAKTTLHDRGVYVNHLGLRGLVLFEPSHLSIDKFVETFRSDETDDIVRHWQDVKENEYLHQKPTIALCSFIVLACVLIIIWRRTENPIESAIWPLLLVYAMSYPSHYYYTFLCMFVLLFVRRTDSRASFVSFALLLAFNLAALVTDYCRPTPIVFYTLLNLYLFVCLAAILGWELYATFTGRRRPVC